MRFKLSRKLYMMLSLIMLSTYHIVFCFSQNGNVILDLQGTTQADFQAESNAWTASSLVNSGSSMVTTCPDYILGGYNILGGNTGQYFERIYSNLPTHATIQFSFSFYVIDSWDGYSYGWNDHFEVTFDSVRIVGGTFAWGGPSNVCGASFNEQPPVLYSGTVVHSNPSVTFRVITYCDSASNDESFGIRNVTMTFLSQVTSQSTMCGTASWSMINSFCTCPESYYQIPPKSGTQCIPCDGSTPCFNRAGNTIYDLQGITLPVFQAEANFWTASALVDYSATSTVTTCPDYILGGYNILGGATGQYFQRIYNNLPAHNTIQFTFWFYPVDSWDGYDGGGNDHFEVTFDSSRLIGGTFHYGGSTNYCGAWYSEQVPIVYSGTVNHTNSSVTFRMISYCDSATNDESLGIRNVTMTFLNQASPQAYMCGTAAFTMMNSYCPCGDSQFQVPANSGGQCYNCDPSCLTCSGNPSSTSCLTCGPGYYLTNDGRCLVCNSSLTSCFSQSGNVIRDLQGTIQAVFQAETNAWTASSLISFGASMVTTCPDYILGGYNILGGSTGEYFQRIYKNLPSHNMIQFTFWFYPIDSWDAWDRNNWNDHFQVTFDSVLVMGGTFHYGGPNNYCGAGDHELGPVQYFGTVSHSGSSLTFRIFSECDQASNDESFGIRNVTMTFLNQSVVQSSMCAVSTYTLLNYNCNCTNISQYQVPPLSGQCFSCDPSCLTCTDSANTSCLTCGTNSYLNSNGQCITCDSSCLTCNGPTNISCTSCPANSYLVNSSSCYPTCNYPLYINTTTFNTTCQTPCPNNYTYWDGNCSSNCNYPLQQTVYNTFNLCTYPCASNQYLYWNGSCLSQCNSPLISSINNSRQFCSNPCTSGQYLYFNGSCIAGCSYPFISRTEVNSNFCDYPCQSNQYLYFNGSCLYQCSSPFINSTQNGKLICSNPCISGQYLYFNSSCLYACAYPFINRTEANRNYCDYPCQSSQYLYWNGSCLSQCNSPLISSTQNSKLICSNPCSSSQYLYFNSSCGTSCPSPLVTRTEANYNYCDYPCQSAQYLYWNSSCLSQCNAPLINNAPNSYLFCTNPCSSGQYLYFNSSCLTNCPSPLITRIEAGRNYCDYPCQSTQYLYWNSTCLSQCNSPLISSTQNTQKFCSNPCSIGQFLYFNGSCLSNCSYPLVSRFEANYSYCDYPCPLGQYLYWDRSCSSQCSTPLISQALDITSTRSLCLFPCSTNQTLYWNGTCSSSQCLPPLISSTQNNRLFCTNPCTAAQFLYWNESCLATCPSPLIVRTEANRGYCYYPCSSSQYLYWDGSCASNCSSPLNSQGSITAGNFCLFGCDSSQYLYWNGTCSSSCPYPLVNTTQNSRLFCSSYCNSTQYLYWNFSCLSSCPAPLTTTIVNQKIYCSFVCQINQYLYYNGTCSNSCPVPFAQRVENSRQFCDYPCSRSQYLSYDGTCTTTCATPLITSSIGGYQFCNLPCNSGYYLSTDGGCQSTCDSKSTSWNVGAVKYCKNSNTDDAITASSPGLARRLLYARYLDIPFSPRLQDLSDKPARNWVTLRCTFELPSSIQSKFSGHNRLLALSQVGAISSFFVNFWEDFITVIIAFLLSIVFTIVRLIAKKRQAAQDFFRQLEILVRWNFCLVLLSTSLDDVIIFASLELIKVNTSSQQTTFSFAILIMALIGTVVLLVVIYLLITRPACLFRRRPSDLQSAKNPKPLDFPSFQVLYKGFNKNHALTRLFYLVYTVRIALPSIVASALSRYSTAQCILFIIISICSIFFIAVYKPIKRKINHIQLLTLEGILLVINIGLLALVQLAANGKSSSSASLALGDLVIAGSICINAVALVFLVIKLSLFLYRIYQLHKQKKRIPATAWLQIPAIYVQQGGMGFEEILDDPTYISDSTVVPLNAKTIEIPLPSKQPLKEYFEEPKTIELIEPVTVVAHMQRADESPKLALLSYTPAESPNPKAVDSPKAQHENIPALEPSSLVISGDESSTKETKKLAKKKALRRGATTKQAKVQSAEEELRLEPEIAADLAQPDEKLEDVVNEVNLQPQTIQKLLGTQDEAEVLDEEAFMGDFKEDKVTTSKSKSPIKKRLTKKAR